MRRHVERHVETLQRQPEHVRHNVALGVAGGITALIAVVWFLSHAANGTFALTGPSNAAEDATQGFADTRENFSSLLGAVGEGLGATSSEPDLTIVDGDTTSTLAPSAQPANQTDATVIAF